MLQATNWQEINIKLNHVIFLICPLNFFVFRISALKEHSHVISFVLNCLCFKLLKFDIFTSQTFFVVTSLTSGLGPPVY
jgi:riboflavin transporter FmnP